MTFFGVVVIGSKQVFDTPDLRSALQMTEFIFKKGRAVRLVRVSTERTLDVTPDYVRNVYPELFPI